MSACLLEGPGFVSATHDYVYWRRTFSGGEANPVSRNLPRMMERKILQSPTLMLPSSQSTAPSKRSSSSPPLALDAFTEQHHTLEPQGIWECAQYQVSYTCLTR